MYFCVKICMFLIIAKFCVSQENRTVIQPMDPKYHLATEAYEVAQRLFTQGRQSYETLKHRSLRAIDLFLDAVLLIDREMATEVRDAVIRFSRIEGLRGFDDGPIEVEEATDITEHCLAEPVSKAEELRPWFRELVANFEDVRSFEPVVKCRRDLPDEVAASHCMLHQAVMFNATMQENLLTIVETKTRQLVREMNRTLFAVKDCFEDFIPRFFNQTLLQAYTAESGSMVVLNAVAADILKDRWRERNSKFLEKWMPVVRVLQDRAAPITKIER